MKKDLSMIRSAGVMYYVCREIKMCVFFIYERSFLRTDKLYVIMIKKRASRFIQRSPAIAREEPLIWSHFRPFSCS